MIETQRKLIQEANHPSLGKYKYYTVLQLSITATVLAHTLSRRDLDYNLQLYRHYHYGSIHTIISVFLLFSRSAYVLPVLVLRLFLI